MLSDFEGKRMIVNYFGHSGNDLKSGKLSSGMGGRFHPESVAGLFRNGWQVCARIYIKHYLPLPLAYHDSSRDTNHQDIVFLMAWTWWVRTTKYSMRSR